MPRVWSTYSGGQIEVFRENGAGFLFFPRGDCAYGLSFLTLTRVLTISSKSGLVMPRILASAGKSGRTDSQAGGQASFWTPFSNPSLQYLALTTLSGDSPTFFNSGRYRRRYRHGTELHFLYDFLLFEILALVWSTGLGTLAWFIPLGSTNLGTPNSCFIEFRRTNTNNFKCLSVLLVQN